MASNESLFVVLFSMVLNMVQIVIKFAAFLLTGSPSMLAETYHSVSDTGNQVLLLIGIYYARKRPDRLHPFGYGKSVFFYSFLVAVLLFGIAGWESAKHGVEALRTGYEVGTGTVTALGYEIRAVYVAYAVLLLSLFFDLATYARAQQALTADADERGWVGFRDAFSKTSDMPVLSVLIENGVASIAGVVALAGIFASDVTGNPVFDAASALLIGVILMGFAVSLGIENKRLLVGEALPVGHEAPLEEAVERVDGVTDVVDLRTVYFGPDNVLVTANVAFEAGLDTEEVEHRISEIEDEIRAEEPLVDEVYIEPEAD